MADGSSDGVLRDGGDEKLIRTLVERILASETFINKIVAMMKEPIEAQVKSLRQEFNDKVTLHENNIADFQAQCDSLEQFLGKNKGKILVASKLNRKRSMILESKYVMKRWDLK